MRKILFLMAAAAPLLRGQMVTGIDIPGFAATLGLEPAKAATSYTVEELAMKVEGQNGPNVLWPGESGELLLRVENRTAARIAGPARLEVIRYGTRGRAGDFWTPQMFRLPEETAVALTVDLPPHAAQRLAVKPAVPEQFGGYALVLEVAGHGRAFAGSVARVLRPDEGRVQYPTYALDDTWPDLMNENVFVLFRKLGVKGARMGASYALDSLPDYAQRTAELTRHLAWARHNDVTVMLTIDNGSGPMPLGRPRPWLSADGHFQKTKDDRAWLPAFDGNFQNWVTRTVERWGWPRGPVNAVELWNEPWEGISISGWGADMLRYRALFERMAKGVEAARRAAGVEVLTGGACSSTNTRDKLFPDGSDRYLPWLDFVSIHYQPMSADPALDRVWVNRKGPRGRVRVWDTESWMANSEDRVAAVIASMRAQGQDRTAGIYSGNVYDSVNRKAGGAVFPVVQAWSPAAAVAAAQKFIGQRRFRELLFRNGLPWIFVFDGISSPDDGTVVVVGDLGGVYDKTRTLFRSVALEKGAKLTLPQGPYAAFDFYGNRLPGNAQQMHIPLNGLGYFLRASGAPGSFERLLEALRDANIRGYDPVEIRAQDFLSRVEKGTALRLTVTNVMNRAAEGELRARVGSLDVSPKVTAIRLEPHETREIRFAVQGHDTASDGYPLEAVFTSAAGTVSHKEMLHVNVIARRTIHVDGDLDDWRGVLPQTIDGSGIGPSETQAAWLPFLNFDKGTVSGVATGYLAYDDRYFYFAAKAADNSPEPGMLRFAKRNDDDYFYPAKSFDGSTELSWPEGVRRFSYRKNFDIPSGNEHDNFQIAFNVLPESEKPLLPFPPGTMRHFMVYSDTDYEYALNPVAADFGGGGEVWRLLAPGMPRKHFYPRQPKAPHDGGPVDGALIAVRREGRTRIVEAALPWEEIPAVRQAMLTGKTIKFSFRVNNNQAPALELAAGRSVSKENAMTFHDDWNTHWANELEFAFEP